MSYAESIGPARLQNARKCLFVIREIADRALSTANEDHLGYALQELTQVLVERTGEQDIRFEPISAAEIPGLPALLEELEFVDSGLQSMIAQWAS